MQLLSHSDVIKKQKKQKTQHQQKKTKQERKSFFLTLCHLYLATLSLKKNHSTVSPLLGHFCIRFRREEEAATVSPIPDPFSSASSHLVIPWPPRLLCHLYMPQFVQKKSRDSIEKTTSSRLCESYIMLSPWNLIPKYFIHPLLYLPTPYP